MGELNEEKDVLITISEASEITGYSKGWISNLIFKGFLERKTTQTDELKSNGIRKRGPKIRMSKKEVITKLNKRMLRKMKTENAA